MFEVIKKDGSHEVFTVFAVDFYHNAFLIFDQWLERFRWVDMEDYVLWPSGGVEQ